MKEESEGIGMRCKKFFFVVILLTACVCMLAFVTCFLFPTLRSYLVRQISETEYNSIVMTTYPSFDPSAYYPAVASYTDSGYLTLTYRLKTECDTPLYFDEYGDSNFIEVFQYDCLLHQLWKLI